MPFYTVHLPPDEDRERARFIREGVDLLALLVPLLWLLWHRLWLPLLVYIALVLTIGLAGRVISEPAVILLSSLPGIYLFIEGRELVRARLARAGWQLKDVVEADNLAEAELRYFNRPGSLSTSSPASSDIATEEEASPATQRRRSEIGIAGPAARPSGQGIGIFSE